MAEAYLSHFCLLNYSAATMLLGRHRKLVRYLSVPVPIVIGCNIVEINMEIVCYKMLCNCRVVRYTH